MARPHNGSRFFRHQYPAARKRAAAACAEWGKRGAAIPHQAYSEVIMSEQAAFLELLATFESTPCEEQLHSGSSGSVTAPDEAAGGKGGRP